MLLHFSDVTCQVMLPAMYSRIIPTTIVLSLSVMMSVGECYGQFDAFRFESDESQFAFMAMLAAREQIRSGDCGIEGSSTAFSGASPAYIRKYSYHLRFDYDSGLSRWDSSETGFPHAAVGDASEEVYRNACSIGTPEMSVSHQPDIIQIHPPRQHPHGWDLRVVGLLQWLIVSNSGRLETTISAWEKSPVEFRVATASDGDGRVRLTLEWTPYDTARNRRVIWLDRELDYAPVRLEIATSYRPDADAPWEAWLPNEVEEALVWNKISGSVVPISLSSRNYLVDHNSRQRTLSQVAAFSFKWRIVNEKVDDADVFSFRSLDKPPGSHRIVDVRREGHVVLQDPGVPDDSLAAIQSLNAAPKMSIRSHESPLLAANVAVFVLGVLGFLLWQVRAARRARRQR